jgi:hypothetical protein
MRCKGTDPAVGAAKIDDMADPLHGFFTGKHCPVVIAMRRDLCRAKNAGAGNAPVLAKAVYFFDLV